jgi:hypothetical protein
MYSTENEIAGTESPNIEKRAVRSLAAIFIRQILAYDSIVIVLQREVDDLPH